MKTPEEIKKGLECCMPRWVNNHWKSCSSKCPYIEQAASCRGQLVYDALAYIQQLENREWDLFDLLSSAWYGKGCYFKQEDGTVYSRVSCGYMSFDQAIDEFAHKLTVEGESLAKDIDVHCWISVEERLPYDLYKRVIVHIADGDCIIGNPDEDTDRYDPVGRRWVRYGDLVTHWMPLPSMPKEET